MTEYRCVLADPPWNESGGGKCKRGADRHYSLMKTKDIIILMKGVLVGYDGPVWNWASYPVADNAHLWLWVTNNYLKDGLQVMDALGFRYITNVAWAKMEDFGMFSKAGGAPFNVWKPQNPGLGQYLAGQHELLLFGVRGKLPAIWHDKESGAKRQSTLLCAPRREHSRKPDEAYKLIENVSLGPRLEMFARHRREGWDFHGDEAPDAK